MALNRLDEAKSALDRGVAIGIGPEVFIPAYYNLAFLRKDEQGMQEQFALAMGKSDYEDAMLSIQSDTEAYHGRLKKGREYSRRAVDSAIRNGTMEVVAVRVVTGALWEAIFGNSAEAKKGAASAIHIAPRGRYIRGVVALALAVAGDNAQAQRLAAELAKEYPQDTLLNAYWLPMIHAQIKLNRHDPTRALEMLGRAQSYEMGIPTPHIAALAVLYLRGYAYLGAGQNKEAAREFQRILERPGIVLNSATGPLAHLGLGRALAAGGETANALAAYEDFFALWKDADPDIPILKQAKAEYEKLQ